MTSCVFGTVKKFSSERAEVKEAMTSRHGLQPQPHVLLLFSHISQLYFAFSELRS
jgi:hypothetical protein